MTEAPSIYSVCPSRALATLVRDALRLPVRRMEYRTRAEGGETIYVFEIPRMPRDSMFDALIQLTSIELHWYEEWDPAQTTPDNAADIVKHWIVPALECCQFRETPVDEVRREITARMETTKWFFQHCPRPPEAGIYIDDVRQPDDVWTLPTNVPIITGALLRSAWNDVDILFATDQHIGRLTWATGA